MRVELPNGWHWVPLSRLVSKIEAGKSFKCEERPPEGAEHGIVKVSAVTWGSYDEDESKTITEPDRINEAYLIKPGDFLFSRANTLQLVGACVLVHAARKRLLLSDKILRLVMPDELKPWVLWFLRSAQGRRQIEALSTGNQESMRNIGQERIGRIEVPLPARAPILRTLSRIEELFSEIDEGERALERVQKLVERYRQSVLNAAVTGELTREWRERLPITGDDAGVLLERIATARRSAFRGAAQRYVEPTAPDPNGLRELPRGWQWVTVEQLCFVETGATPKRDEAKYYAGGTVPWVTSGAVNTARITEPTELITRRAVSETNAKIFPSGTLIVAMYGEGKTRGKVSELGIPAATNQACAALLVASLDSAVRRYVRLFFEKHYEELRGEAAGGVQPNLNLSIIKQTLLPLPPLEEVREICDRVDARLSESQAVGAEITRREPAVRALRQAVLKAAFTGQLVPQDPTDEPASALLARLAAQAHDTPAAPRRRGRPAAGARS